MKLPYQRNPNRCIARTLLQDVPKKHKVWFNCSVSVTSGSAVFAAKGPAPRGEWTQLNASDSSAVSLPRERKNREWDGKMIHCAVWMAVTCRNKLRFFLSRPLDKDDSTKKWCGTGLQRHSTFRQEVFYVLLFCLSRRVKKDGRYMPARIHESFQTNAVSSFVQLPIKSGSS